MIKVVGNSAVAAVAHRLSEIIAVYPITPSSPMGEHADKWSANECPNLWSTVPQVIEMQSEAGVDFSYLCIAPLNNGPAQIGWMCAGVIDRIGEYESLEQLKGSLSQHHCPDPVEIERGNYMKVLGSYKLSAPEWQ